MKKISFVFAMLLFVAAAFLVGSAVGPVQASKRQCGCENCECGFRAQQPITVDERGERILRVDRIVVGDQDGACVEIRPDSLSVWHDAKHNVVLTAGKRNVGVYLRRNERGVSIWSNQDCGTALGIYSDLDNTRGCDAALGLDQVGSGTLQLSARKNAKDREPDLKVLGLSDLQK